ncbi:MAG TPA: SMP-30/gluconolactonase/LRE family protein [Jatrophihabitantaceae bacterium]|nr:SMP-30/gluconolactonase/LRE family protein [Jatrophihabitantaceae bacterium]
MPSLLAEGLGIPESPRWHDGRLWLCNWTAGQIVAIDDNGNVEVMADVATTIPFSIDWLPDGRLLVVSGQEALLLRQEPDGSLVTHADLRPFGDVFNEIVVDSRGNAFVNGASIVHVTPNGDVREVARDIEFGNGMALTPDERTLLVAESHGMRITAFDVTAQGSLAQRRVWAGLGGDNPDGICVDADGAVWYASVPGRHCVRVREGGEVAQVVDVDRGCFACMLGGADGRSLYIAAAQWHGMDRMFDAPPEGVVFVAQVAVPHTGRP